MSKYLQAIQNSKKATKFSFKKIRIRSKYLNIEVICMPKQKHSAPSSRNIVIESSQKVQKTVRVASSTQQIPQSWEQLPKQLSLKQSYKKSKGKKAPAAVSAKCEVDFSYDSDLSKKSLVVEKATLSMYQQEERNKI